MKQFDLRNFFKRLNKSPKSYVPEKIKTCNKVWIRVDRVRRSLEASYLGPSTVFQRTPKYFVIKTNNDIDTRVSVDWLKPQIEIQNKEAEKPVKERVEQKKKPTYLTPVVDARVGQENYSMKPSKSSSGRRVFRKKHNGYFYYFYY